MKRIIHGIVATGCAVGMIAWTGCGGVEVDPDAAANEKKEKVADPGDPEADVDSKGEKNFKPKKRDDSEDE